MSEETGAVVPAGGEASASPAVETAAQTEASVPAGNAPGGDVDAGGAGEATGGGPAAQSAAQFAFLKRQFRDQKHAEEVLGSEVGMTRGLQRQNADLTKRLSMMEAELNALRPLVVERQGQGRGQGVREGGQAPGASQSFAKELAESGELELIGKIFADPEMGPAHAMYRMAELLDQRNSKQLEQFKGEVTGTIQQREARQQHEATVARAFTAAKNLVSDYPELDDDNQSDEAAEAQQAIVKIITDSPPVRLENGQVVPRMALWLAQEPAECLRYAAERYRREHGTPIFAQAPGTSGSPSVRAAQAAEAAGAVAATIEGSGVPRQRTNGQPETPAERIKRENREINRRVARTPSGRPLGFDA